jgi:hypothetical protein
MQKQNKNIEGWMGAVTKHLRNYLQPFEDPLHLYRHR